MKNYSLTQAILEDSELLADDDHLVIFKEDLTDERWFVDGFLEASNLMIDSLIKKGPHAGDDILIYPILFSYVHSLEVSLKVYLNKLIEHKKKSKCTSISITQDFGKSLQNHDIKNLYNKTWEIVNNDFVHGNSGFKSIESLILSIENYGITHESLRYYTLKEVGGNKLLSSQKWVDLKKMKSIFNESINFILSSASSKDFDFCDCGDIKPKESKELKYIQDLLILVDKKVGKFQSSHGSLPNGLPTPERMIDHHSFDLKIEKELDSMNDNTLALINRGIRFGSSSPITIPNTPYILSWGRNEMKRHFSEKIHLIDEAIKYIGEHKNYIDLKVSQKKKAET